MSLKSDKLLILDLDETLVYATSNKLEHDEDFKLDKYFIYTRPYLSEFLIEASSHFTVGIWSSAGDEYVREVVNLIKPGNVEFFIVWGRSKCSMKKNHTYDTYYFEKRLDKFKKHGFPLDKIIMVDDTPEKVQVNYGNAIYIQEFKGDFSDNELPSLLNYILTLKTVDNIRTIEKRGWRSKSNSA